MKPQIYRTTWAKDGARLGALRREVFVREQNVPEELEWDEFDSTAIHFACEQDAGGEIIGTARLVVDARANKATIGRLCVAKSFRRQKVATLLMREILEYCRQRKFALIELHAQLYLRAFYESFGFVAQGSAYIEAGIGHLTMVRAVPTN